MSTREYGWSTLTDDRGGFTIAGLIPGAFYSVVAKQTDDGRGKLGYSTVARLSPRPGEQIDLGTLEISTPYRRPTLEEFTKKRFIPKPPEERLARGLTMVKSSHLRLLLIASDPESAAARDYYRYRYEAAYHLNDTIRGDTHRLLSEFVPMSLVASESSDFLRSQAITVPDEGDVTFAVIGSDGELVAETSHAEMCDRGEFDPERLVEFLTNNRPPELPNANRAYESALVEAGESDRRLLIQLGGPGCGWCGVLSEHLARNRAVLSKDYVHLKLDTRMEEYEQLTEKLTQGRPRGIPWMATQDAQGTTLVTSEHEQRNIGMPHKAEEVGHLKTMLLSTRVRLTDEEIDQILQPFLDRLAAE